MKQKVSKPGLPHFCDHPFKWLEGNTDILKMSPWTHASPTPNSRAQLHQGEETRKEQWDPVQPFIHLSCGEQTRVVQLRRACAPTKPVRGNYCPVLVLITIPEAPAYVFTLGHPCHRSCLITLQELSWSGLEGRMQWFPAAASAGLTVLCPSCRDESAVRAQLSKAFERYFCFTSNCLSQWLIRHRELSTVETPDKLLVYWTL